MGRKKREQLEFRFYEVPVGEAVLGLLGDRWTGTYGHADICKHFHNLFEIGYCYKGYGLLGLGEKETVYEDDTVSAIPANYPHITISEGIDTWAFLFLDPEELIREMYPDNPRRQGEALQTINKRADLFHAKEQPELTAAVRKILYELQMKKPYYKEMVRYLAKICLLELLRVQEERESETSWTADYNMPSLAQVMPALKYVDKNYTGEIKIFELAKECRLSEPHFRRLFTESMSMTPTDYINLIRVQTGCKLLNKTDKDMETVAAECGFASISAFTRNFRKFLDTTPYQWKLDKDNYRSNLRRYRISAQKGKEALEFYQNHSDIQAE